MPWVLSFVGLCGVVNAMLTIRCERSDVARTEEVASAIRTSKVFHAYAVTMGPGHVPRCQYPCRVRGRLRPHRPRSRSADNTSNGCAGKPARHSSRSTRSQGWRLLQGWQPLPDRRGSLYPGRRPRLRSHWYRVLLQRRLPRPQNRQRRDLRHVGADRGSSRHCRYRPTPTSQTRPTGARCWCASTTGALMRAGV